MDPAVKRSGRFDRVINIPSPSFESRIKLFKFYLDKMSIDWTKIDIKTLAGLTMGFTGADIKNMVNYSGFEALKRKSDSII